MQIARLAFYSDGLLERSTGSSFIGLTSRSNGDLRLYPLSQVELERTRPTFLGTLFSDAQAFSIVEGSVKS